MSKIDPKLRNSPLLAKADSLALGARAAAESAENRLRAETDKARGELRELKAIAQSGGSDG